MEAKEINSHFHFHDLNCYFTMVNDYRNKIRVQDAEVGNEWQNIKPTVLNS